MFTVKLILKFYKMLKSILNLEGAQQLNKSEQKAIHGGGLIVTVCSSSGYSSQGQCESNCSGRCADYRDGAGLCWLCIGPNMK